MTPDRGNDGEVFMSMDEGQFLDGCLFFLVGLVAVLAAGAALVWWIT